MPNADNTALIAIMGKNNRPICANCKRANHHTEYCISAGGAMAGKTFEEARVAQEAAHAAQKTTTGSSGKSHGTHCNTPQPGATAQASTAQANPPPLANDYKMIINRVYYIPAQESHWGGERGQVNRHTFGNPIFHHIYDSLWVTVSEMTMPSLNVRDCSAS